VASSAASALGDKKSDSDENHEQDPTQNKKTDGSKAIDVNDDGDEPVAAAERISTIRSLEQKVASGGNNFSAGQRQLLALARTILRRPKIIILDEVKFRGFLAYPFFPLAITFHLPALCCKVHSSDVKLRSQATASVDFETDAQVSHEHSLATDRPSSLNL
jgi:hypothetical protein